MKHLFLENGTFYKANLHAHTHLSDGALSPYEIKTLYKENGYDIVAFTDHEVLVDHSHLSDSTFLALNGYEMSFCQAGRSTPKRATCHLNLIAKSSAVKEQIAFDASFLNQAQQTLPLFYNGASMQREYSTDCINEVLSLCANAGFFPVLNHPFWSLQSESEFSLLEGLQGVEVYNHLCRLNGSEDRSARALDAFLRAGKRPLPIAADDNHNHLSQADPCYDSFGGFEMICAASLSYDAVIEALEAGHAYASTGPRIESLTSEDGYICFHTTPVREVRLLSDVRPNAAVLLAHPGESITHGALKIPDACTYVRFECIDSEGNTAYTRAYDFSEI